MNENDLIAEYIKTYYPNILGLHYHLWKFTRYLTAWIPKALNTFFGNYNPLADLTAVTVSEEAEEQSGDYEE